MKNSIFVLALLFFASCQPAQPAKNEPQNVAPKSEKVSTSVTTIKELLTNGKNLYVSVGNFEPKNKDCWNEIKSFAHEKDNSGLTLIHFMDTETFTLPAEGGFYGKKYSDKVIAQYLIPIQGLTADPTGMGKYVEPK